MGNTQAGAAGGIDPSHWRDAACRIFQPSVVTRASTSINPNVADATSKPTPKEDQVTTGPAPAEPGQGLADDASKTVEYARPFGAKTDGSNPELMTKVEQQVDPLGHLQFKKPPAQGTRDPAVHIVLAMNKPVAHAHDQNAVERYDLQIVAFETSPFVSVDFGVPLYETIEAILSSGNLPSPAFQPLSQLFRPNPKTGSTLDGINGSRTFRMNDGQSVMQFVVLPYSQQLPTMTYLEAIKSLTITDPDLRTAFRSAVLNLHDTPHWDTPDQSTGYLRAAFERTIKAALENGALVAA